MSTTGKTLSAKNQVALFAEPKTPLESSVLATKCAGILYTTRSTAMRVYYTLLKLKRKITSIKMKCKTLGGIHMQALDADYTMHRLTLNSKCQQPISHAQGSTHIHTMVH